jgi:hypothetical protein
MDLFHKNDNDIARRKFKRRFSKTRNKHNSEIYIRMVLPTAQTTAKAKSILERQAKPYQSYIDMELQRMKENDTKQKQLKGSKVKLNGISRKRNDKKKA